mmetsp:Transcript_84594/g.217978  ORF Transcript_84594/g.217978 Transcript_84594/m.217978 type:complete len:325 (-) Transcript_84594:36-1010(-)
MLGQVVHVRLDEVVGQLGELRQQSLVELLADIGHVLQHVGLRLHDPRVVRPQSVDEVLNDDVGLVHDVDVEEASDGTIVALLQVSPVVLLVAVGVVGLHDEHEGILQRDPVLRPDAQQRVVGHDVAGGAVVEVARDAGGKPCRVALPVRNLRAGVQRAHAQVDYREQVVPDLVELDLDRVVDLRIQEDPAVDQGLHRHIPPRERAVPRPLHRDDVLLRQHRPCWQSADAIQVVERHLGRHHLWRGRKVRQHDLDALLGLACGRRGGHRAGALFDRHPLLRLDGTLAHLAADRARSARLSTWVHIMNFRAWRHAMRVAGAHSSFT